MVNIAASGISVEAARAKPTTPAAGAKSFQKKINGDHHECRVYCRR
jgi:hypothetical protein